MKLKYGTLAAVILGFLATNSAHALTSKAAIDDLENYLSLLQHSGKTPDGQPCTAWGGYGDQTWPKEYEQPGAGEIWTNIIVTIGSNPGVVFALSATDPVTNFSSDANKIYVHTHYVTYGEDDGHKEQATLDYSVTIDRSNNSVTVTSGSGNSKPKSATCIVNSLSTSEDPNAGSVNPDGSVKRQF